MGTSFRFQVWWKERAPLMLRYVYQDHYATTHYSVARANLFKFEAIFKRCGPILSSKLHSPPNDPNPIIRIIFKTPASAATAVQKFHNQQADGRTLNVSIIGGAGVSLGGRLGGLNDVGNSGSVDALMDDTSSGGSWVISHSSWKVLSRLAQFQIARKMRSDAMISDPRASVQIAPPGADPREYTQQTRGGGRGRGGGRRGKRGDGGGKRSGMDIDWNPRGWSIVG